MGGVEVPHAPRGMRRVGGVYPPPHWGKGLGREQCPCTPKKFLFFVENAIF